MAQDDASDTKTIPNPAALKITSVTVLHFDPAVANKSPGLLTVKIVGAGFSPRLRLDSVDGALLSASKVVYVSPSEAIVRLVAPEPVIVFTLIDNGTNATQQVIVQRRAAEKKTEGSD